MDFENISAQAFRQYRQQHEESAYLVVDVRQPEEYRQGHIPGAKLMPLDELESNLSELGLDQDIFFFIEIAVPGPRRRPSSP